MPDRLKGFISYSVEDRHKAAAVKEYVADVGVDCFMAHDDLGVSDVWRERIIEELQRMEVFIALLSKDFIASDWASQEVGFAIARREVPILPISIDDTVPFGFMGDLQAKRFTQPLTDSLFVPPLQQRYPRQLIGALISRLANARSFRGAEARMDAIRPLFENMTPAEIDEFVEVCIANNQIWNASLCATEYIPEFIELHRTPYSSATQSCP